MGTKGGDPILIGVPVQPVGVPANIDMNPITPTNAVATATKNIRGGPATVRTLEVDNSATGTAKAYVKLYNIIDSSLVAGTSKPCIMFPVPAKGEGGTGAELGLITCEVLEGAYFDEGISVLASGDDGDAMTTALSATLTMWLTTN